MYVIKIDTEKCTGCSKCVDICPNKALEIEEEKCVPKNADECAGCMSCVEVCEEKCIEVEET